MKIILTIILLSITSLVWFVVGSSGNLEWVKERAEEKWSSQGFEVVNHGGYQWGFGGFGTNYGGAKVWYMLKKKPDNDITYAGYLIRWGDEVHVYGPRAIDAIRP